MTAVGSRLTSLAPRLLRWESLLALLLIAFVWLGAGLSPFFLTASNFSILTDQQMEVAIMTLPMTLIIVAGEIDLSVEGMLGLSSAILGATWAAGWPLWLGITFVLVVGATGGLFNGLLVTRAGLPSLVVTLGTLALFRGLAYVVLGSRGVSNFPAGFNTFGFGDVPGTLVPWPFVLYGALAVVFIVILHRSWIGRQLFAIGRNKEAARFAGLRVAQVKTWLYVCSGTLSALAGVVLTARLSSSRADNGQGLLLSVVTAVLLGGVNIFGGQGTVAGVVLAVFVIGVLRSGLALADVSAETQTIAVGALLVLSVVTPNLVTRVREAISRRRTAAVGS